HMGAGGVPEPGDGDPQPPVELHAGRHVADHHVEHVQVRAAVAAHVRSLPEQAGTRQPAGPIPALPPGPKPPSHGVPRYRDSRLLITISEYPASPERPARLW